MKKVVLSSITVLALAFTGVSCSSDDNNSGETVINYSELSADCKTFVETYFTEYDILRVEKDIHSVDEYYEVKLVGGIQIDLNESCEWTEVDGNNQAIPTGFILPAIVDYVTANYSATSIESIDKKPYGFDVDLLNNTELRFDAQGLFLGLGN